MVRHALFDELGFAEQRAEFSGCLLELDAANLLRQAEIGFTAPVTGKVRRDAIAHIDTLADIERQRVLAVKQVDAGRFRQRIERVFGQLRRQARDAQRLLCGDLNRVGLKVAIQRLHKFPNRPRVGERAMAIGHWKVVAFDQGVEVVSLHIGKQSARQLHRTQHARRKAPLETRELVLEEAVVKTGVVRNKDAAAQQMRNVSRKCGERWRFGNHSVRDAGQCDDRRRNADARIDERAPFGHLRNATVGVGVYSNDADLRDAIARCARAGRFEVDEGKRRSEKAHWSSRGNAEGPAVSTERAVLTRRTFVRYSTAMANDRSYLAALQDYYARHRALPSYASIGSLLGLRSKSSVAALVARLKLAGYLESTPDRRLAPTPESSARPDPSVRRGTGTRRPRCSRRALSRRPSGRPACPHRPARGPATSCA